MKARLFAITGVDWPGNSPSTAHPLRRSFAGDLSPSTQKFAAARASSASLSPPRHCAEITSEPESATRVEIFITQIQQRPTLLLPRFKVRRLFNSVQVNATE
jgi:hypothetical protein